MAQQYKFSTADGKHASFYSRPVPTFQLMGQATPFNNNFEANLSTPSIRSSINLEKGTSFSSDDSNPKYYSNDSNQRSRPRHFNAKSRDSQLSDILSHNCVPDIIDEDSDQDAVNQAAFDRAERAQSLVGGQAAGSDVYRTMAQAHLTGDFDQKKKASSKKMQSYDNSISPVTGVTLTTAGKEQQITSSGYTSNSIETDGESSVDPLIDKVRKTMAKRGATGILGMARLFRIMDDDDSKTLSMPEFKKAMRDSSLVLQDKELAYLFKLFDTDANGSISYDEFLHILRGPLNSRRKGLVRLAFNVIDKDGSGTLEINDICDVYDVIKHPDFISKRKSKDQILKEFLDAFVIGGMASDGLISHSQFEDYYANIGASIESDDYFELMIRNAWHISGGEGQAANTANRRVLATRSDGSQYVQEIKNDLGLRRGDKEGMMGRLKVQGAGADVLSAEELGSAGDSLKGFGKPPSVSNGSYGGRGSERGSGVYSVTPPQGANNSYNRSNGVIGFQTKASKEHEYALELLEALKEQLFSRGGKGLIGLQRQFRIMDDDGSKSLDIKEFKKAMTETHVRMRNPSDAEVLFKLFDRDRSGTISYEEFLTTVRGGLNPHRKDLVNMAFEILDKNGSGEVDPSDLVGVYDTSKHPDVISKKKTCQEVLREFLDGFDVGGVVDGMVTRQEFENYYANVSASIDDDTYFELMIRNAWHISGGEGQAANTANRRVLATRSDGSQYVQEIKNDLGLRRGDKEGMMGRLKVQGAGADVTDVSEYGGSDSTQQGAKLRPETASIVSRLRNQAVANRINRTPAPNEPPPPAVPVTLMEIARLGPKGGDYGLPPSPAPVPPIFTSSKKMGISSKVFDAPNALINPQKMAPAGLCLMIDRIKGTLKSRGSNGYVALQRTFQGMDDDGNGSLTISELKNALKKINLPIPESDIRQIFEYFDKDGSGSIDFNEFIVGLRDPLSVKRLALVNMAYTELDTQGTDIVSFEIIATRYQASMHPEVAVGRVSEKAALANFLETFDAGIEIDGMVTRNEFVNYYCNIGASIDSDEYFDLLLRGVWNLHGSARNLNKQETSSARGVGTGVSVGGIGRGVSGKSVTAQNASRQSVASVTSSSTPRPVSAFAARPVKGIGIAANQYAVQQQAQLQQQTQHQMLLQVAGQTKLAVPSTTRSLNTGTAFPPPNDTSSKAAPYYSYAYSSEKPLSAGEATAAKILGTRLNPAEKIPDNGLLYLISRIKRELIARGPIGFASLQRMFQTADVNGDGTLSLVEFKNAIQSLQLNIKENESRMLFQYFDTDDSKSIHFEEFVGGLRDDLTPARLDIVEKAFRKLDISRNGMVDIGYLARDYDPSQHPDVLAGRLTAKQAMGIFLDTFDGGGDVGGKVTMKEFVNYYSNIGATMQSDEDFEALVRGVWGLGMGEKRYPIIITYDTKSIINSPPCSLRKALQDSQSDVNKYVDWEQGGSPYTIAASSQSAGQHEILNEAQIRIDVKNMESQAIKKFTQRDYLGAGVIFEEAYSILNKILSSSNPECIKIAKSIEACRSKR